MEILKNVILALHIIGVVALLGGVLYQSKAASEGGRQVLPAMMHGAWTMLITGIALVGLRYQLVEDGDVAVDNTKISVKLLVLVAIIVVALMNRKKQPVASWVLPTIGVLTVVNVLLATIW